MAKIRLLPSELVAKIAAGEVVERPASVIKELVENSLDAGATNIQIDIEKSGLRKIVVTDDGIGMDKDDLLQCYKAHATSKLSSEQDLLKINSLGFRGEALSSIAAVSTFTVKSKTKNNLGGHLLTLKSGIFQSIEPQGMSNGTQIIVESLFAATPARKKFLKSFSYEFVQILSLLSKIALSFHSIGFTLSHNGKISLDLPKNQTRKERVRTILGNQVFSNLIPASCHEQGITITGFIGSPQIANKSKNRQFLFINNRSIRNNPISLAIKEQYGSLLDPRSYPVFILFISAPLEQVDINVHPRKEEVRFANQAQIVAITKEAITKALQTQDLSYRPYELSFANSGYSFMAKDAAGKPYRQEDFTAHFLKKNVPLWSMRTKEAQEQIMQINNLYLAVQTKGGLLLIDQHAAHERILYEQLLKIFQKSKTEHTHTLDQGIVFDLPLAEKSLLLNKIDDFIKLGFGIEPFGNNSFKVNYIPELFKNRDIGALIAEVLDDLTQQRNPLAADKYSERIIAYLACRSAIKAGDPLSQEERRRLVDKLAETTSNYTCPHGRPVQIKISLSDLETMFKRK